MKTTVIVNDLAELKAVAQHFGIEVKASSLSVSFPCPFEIHDLMIENEELTFEQFKEKYLK